MNEGDLYKRLLESESLWGLPPSHHDLPDNRDPVFTDFEPGDAAYSVETVRDVTGKFVVRYVGGDSQSE